MSEKIIDTICGAVGMVLSFLFGRLDGMLATLIVLSSLDYITGVFNACFKGELSSAEGFKGIARKITIFLFVGMAHVIDTNMLGGSALLRDGVIFFYIANEGVSILENAVGLDLPVPETLKNFLKKVKDKSETTEPEKQTRETK